METFWAGLAPLIDHYLHGDSSATLLLVLAFLFGTSLFLLFAFILAPALQTRTRITEQLKEAGVKSRRDLLAAQEMERLGVAGPAIEMFQKIKPGDTESAQALLYRAGFYGANGPKIFHLARVGLCSAMFLASFVFARQLFPGVPLPGLFLGALVYSLLFYVLPPIYLRRRAKRLEESCRRGFPDFMDMMIVCADAGLSLEASTDKVATELAYTHKTLGIHLRIMVLEVRAGRPLREALAHLAERLKIEEARTLAVLFKQSEELGTSLTQTLRVFSAEMRDKRIVAAEEKANALPVKMMIPLGFCVFPVMLVMIMLPVVIRMKGIFF